jgi:hypothetical protein
MAFAEAVCTAYRLGTNSGLFKLDHYHADPPVDGERRPMHDSGNTFAAKD